MAFGILGRVRLLGVGDDCRLTIDDGVLIMDGELERKINPKVTRAIKTINEIATMNQAFLNLGDSIGFISSSGLEVLLLDKLVLSLSNVLESFIMIRIGLLILLLLIFLPLIGFLNFQKSQVNGEKTVSIPEKYWFILHRKSGEEILYLGAPGDINNSKIVRKFQVKTGASWSPTPLPNLVGREYWKIIKKESSKDNPDTSPYFLTLDVPADENWPYGPVPYTECKDLNGNNIQCDWVQMGYFGLHGVGGNNEKLSKDDYGSSGCIRHRDEDITYLYNLLDPEKEEIRYYIKNI